jgi:hypothetical protein
MKVANIVLAFSMVGVTGVAMAKSHKKADNCEVNGKKVHVKNEEACTKKKGTWLESSTQPASAPAGAAGEAAPAAGTTAPAGGEAAPAK